MRKLIPTLLLGSTLAAAASWYEDMQIGPAWSNSFTYQHEDAEKIGAVKGILLDLGGGLRALFDTETLRYATVYRGGIVWGGTAWNGDHGPLLGVANDDDPLITTRNQPGWADPEGSFRETRETFDYNYYTERRERIEASGPLGDIPNGSFLGYYRHGDSIVLEYEINGTRILDHPTALDGRFVRHLQVAPHRRTLRCFLADSAGAKLTVSGPGGLEMTEAGLVLELPASDESVALVISEGDTTAEPLDLSAMTRGGPRIWDGTIETEAQVATGDNDAWVVDTITLPTDNPWKANLRFGAFDFLDADRAALSTWNGDVWVVCGLEAMEKLEWTRFASGLFDPLGLKVVAGTIHVHGRDQITRLHDLDDDGQADHFEVFNRDATVTPNFHEFAFDLQTDADGNFYTTKAAPVRPGGRGFDTILKHHGTVVKVSPDGSKSEIVATGLRAAGGLSVGPDGEVTTGENEGTWQPTCKINLMTRGERPSFFGTEDTRHHLRDAPYLEPLVYLPMELDNSGASQVWVPEGADFGLADHELLHLSYGTSTIYRVLRDEVDGTRQGAVVPLPVRLGSSAMRARFHPDGSLFVVGFRGWQTNAASESAFQRIRRSDTPVPIPGGFEVTPDGVRIRFAVALDRELAEDPFSWSVERWDYVRGPQYGSGEFSVDEVDAEARELALRQESKGRRNRDSVEVESARLLDDNRTVELGLAGHKPSMQLKVAYDLESEDGDILISEIHATVHTVPSQ